VMLVYDALGLTHPVYTAADMLAALMPKTLGVMPDFFKGNPLGFSVFSLPEEERNKVVGKWFSEVADLQVNQAAAKDIMAHAKDAGFSNVAKWGAFGLCWGGKMTALMSAAGTPLTVAGTGHPG
jgi:dienelactone hydrolase